MTSRRPMTRTYSGNGRTSSFSEEDSSSSNGRPESRNTYLSNVRPENRSTLCSVMAQLTEDIQPSFETTVKSKAVSENCNVKFSCVVSGYPAPELKWYKDDMEMDRYCGLPKYEIRRNGKTHTLHIYNCTLDDAAIYQASASNSKGIVSCSGVLEVGTMNEYKIHQRFFAKLKQKAEKKRSELEAQTKKGDKENIQEKRQSSPERPPRKRHIPQPEELPKVKEPEAVEQLGAAAEPNGVSAEVKETVPVTSKDSDLAAKKKPKITNGVDTGVNNGSSSTSSSNGRSHMMGNGGENCYDGGIGLAQFLAETLQAQTAEEKQNSPRGEKPKEIDTPVVSASKEKEREQERMRKESEEQEKAREEECEREKRREEELTTDVRESERPVAMSYTVPYTKHGSEVKHHSKAHKDQDHHNIQASISSMLHSVKDFLFGKGKKDSHDYVENKEREFDQLPSQPEMPPSFQLQPEHNQVCKPLAEDVVPMETDEPKQPSETVDIEQQSELNEYKAAESREESKGQSVKEAEDAGEAMEVSVGPGVSSPGEEMSLSGLQALTKAESQAVSVVKEVSVHQQEPGCLVVSPQPIHQAATNESSPKEDISVLPQTQTPNEEESSPTPTLTSLEESWTPPYSVISGSDSHNLGETPTDTLQEEDKSGDKIGKDVQPEEAEEGLSSKKLSEEEKAEVKSNKQPRSVINRSEITELTTSSLEESIKLCESKTPDQVLLPTSTVAAYSVERDHVKEAEHASLIQEMNIGFPPTAAPESLEKGDLKIQQECASSILEESAEVQNVSTIQSPNSGFKGSEERSELKEVLISALEKDLDVSSCKKTQEPAILEGKSSEARNESLPFEVETEKDPMKVEKFDESDSDSERPQDWPSENIPQIQISTTEDTPDIKPAVPDVNPNKQFVIPKIAIMDPELKECSLPLTILSQNKQESMAAVMQKHDATHVSAVIPQDQGKADSQSLLPTQKGMTNDYIKPNAPDVNPNEHFVIPKIEIMEPELKECTLPPAILSQNNQKSESAIMPKHDATHVSAVITQDQGKADSQSLLPTQKGMTNDYNKPNAPDVNPNEHFVIPKIEIMEPELKECTLPPTILSQNKQKSESAIMPKHDATHVSVAMIQDQSMADSSSLLPTQKGMQNDYNLSPTDKVKEIAQLGDKTETFERDQARMKSSEQLPQMDFASIPLISVSCTDDKEDDGYVNTHVSDTPQPFETSAVPSFVVPPISVTCHESDSALTLSTQSESETETSAATQRGTKHDVENSMTIKPEKTQSRKQNLEEMSEKMIKESPSSMLFEGLIPKVGENGPSFSKTTEDNIVPETLKTKPLKEPKIENSVSVEDLQRNRSSGERLCSKPPTHPSLSPASLRKFMSRSSPDSDTVGDRQSDKVDDDLSGGSTPTSSLSCESSPRLKRRDSLSLIRSATPEELASGARRKIFIPKPKEDVEGAVVGALDTQGKKESPYMSPSQARRAALLQAPTGQNTPPMERRSPLLSRRKVTLEVPKVVEETPTEEPVSTKREEKPAEKKLDPLKAPQVIRKIRGEPFPDASGHLKLWCQFFNVLSDSTIKWFRDEEEILELKRSGGDESQVALAIVLASSQDCGVYGCSISNEYGTDTTDFLLSEDILSEILLKDDLEVGEEIEMTPLLFSRGLADSGNWGDKYFGRIMTEAVNIGEGCAHKTSRVKVIYGLDPIFESGSACIIKVQNPIPYGTKQESNLAERNIEITKQECKVQNMIREYCKIFAAEARVIENFGCSLEVIPQYLMYRPANSVPYATVEADLKGAFLRYCTMDPKGKLITRTASEVEQKCSTLQHWIHQWTHGNLLVTRLDGVETKITNVKVVTKSKGYQGLTEYGSPEVFEQFLTHHQCNYYCGLLGLRSLKTMDSLQPTKIKGSRSPLLNRKLGSNSPQLQRKGQSPQMIRKANSSPKVPRKVQETEDNKSGAKPMPAETVDVLEMR
ncbi:alpha-protein kinase 3 [Pagrus major]|uniref:alpha-protein kinase 3 n=1 Tax=Pagrus major TaxID=143350 RepID=UPI003CC86FA1